MARVIAFLNDVFFQARIAETAKKVGVEFSAVRTLQALLDAAIDKSSPPTLIIVDLNAGSAPSFGPAPGANAASPRVTGIEALEQLRAAGNQTPVVAFLSHVQTDLASRARALVAANGQVMPRSQFTQDLAELLSRAKSSSEKTV